MKAAGSISSKKAGTSAKARKVARKQEFSH